MSGLNVRNLRKSFGDVVVLDGVDLEVGRGQMLAALGPSGGGKTTLLRIVAGFLSADSGEVSFGTTDFVASGRQLPAQQRRVGYVPQEGALFPHLDVRANIVFGLGRRDRRDFDIAELMRLVDLTPTLATRYPHELSGGQQQRVALARALAPGPDLVLLDEPFSSLDASLRVETGEAVVHALRSTGATSVLVTHDQGEALALADRVAIVRAGKVVQTDSPVGLYRTPADVGVASFVGDVVTMRATVVNGVASCALGEVAVGPDTAAGAVTLVLRPEDLQLVAAHDGASTLATVDDVRYLGHEALVRLRISADVPVLARVTGTQIPDVGATVGVRVSGVPVIYPEAVR